MVLDEKAIATVYCPECSQGITTQNSDIVYDNDWGLALNMDVVRMRAPVMDISPENVTAEWVFDEGYATWVGITPDDFQKRDLERSEIQKLAKTDLRAYINAMREWGVSREKRFIQEGWRKMKLKGAC
jgi:hypothetical protein